MYKQSAMPYLVTNSTKNNTSVTNSTQSPSENYPPIDDDIVGLIDGITS